MGELMSFPLEQEGENLSLRHCMLGVERMTSIRLIIAIAISCYCSQTQVCQTFCCMLSIERGIYGVNNSNNVI